MRDFLIEESMSFISENIRGKSLQLFIGILVKLCFVFFSLGRWKNQRVFSHLTL